MKRMAAAIVATLALGGAAATSATADYPAPNQKAAQAICRAQGGTFDQGVLPRYGPAPAYYCFWWGPAAGGSVSPVNVLDSASLQRVKALCKAADGTFFDQATYVGPTYPDDVDAFWWGCHWLF